MIGRFGHPDQRTKPQAALTEFNSSVTCLSERIDVDYHIRLRDIELHKIGQSRAAGEILDFISAAGACWIGGGGKLRSFVRFTRALIEKSAHGYCVLAVFICALACFTASTIFGWAAQRQRLPLIYSLMSASFSA